MIRDLSAAIDAMGDAQLALISARAIKPSPAIDAELRSVVALTRRMIAIERTVRIASAA